jgi:hypothetical protein
MNSGCCCPGCEQAVHILEGPDTYKYDFKTGRVWHKQCLDEKEG